MTRSVFTKVFMNYIALGFACFFLIVSGGSYLIELRLEERTVQELQKEVSHIAKHEAFDSVVSAENMKELERPLNEIADFQRYCCPSLKGRLIRNRNLPQFFFRKVSYGCCFDYPRYRNKGICVPSLSYAAYL